MNHKEIIKNISKDLGIPKELVEEEIDKYFKLIKSIIVSKEYHVIRLPRFARLQIDIRTMRSYIKLDTGQKSHSVLKKIEHFKQVLDSVKGKFKFRTKYE